MISISIKEWYLQKKMIKIHCLLIAKYFLKSMGSHTPTDIIVKEKVEMVY